MRRLVLDDPERNADRLIARIAELLDPLLDEIGRKGRAVDEIQVVFRFERLGDHVETLKPAAPTLSAKLLIDLVRLRLQAVRRLPDGVMEIVLVARASEPAARQERLFAVRARRDLAAANRALARVRARLGDEAVVRAVPRDGHLPESSFAWEPMTALAEAAPRPVDEPRLVRRIHAREPVRGPRGGLGR